MIQTTVKEYIKNPYPGIRSFDSGESHLFFGREKHTYELLKMLTKTHFIVISGASGSGKSSLVKAGLIPELEKISNNWSALAFRPGNHPFANMADSLFEVLLGNGLDIKETCSYKDIEQILRGGTENLMEYLNRINFRNHLLLYVDQFEEIFRYRDDEYKQNSKEDSELFVDFLIELSKQKSRQIYVVLSMRTDFLSDCTEFERLPDMINEGHYLIPKMTIEEKEEAINGPATYAGAKISEALSERLKEQIGNEVSLPVLQHAMMRTWDYWMINAEQNQPVDVEHYLAIGTVSDALSVHAEQIYGSLPNAELKKLTEKIFKALTQLGEDNRGIRRPARLDEICKITGAHEEDVVTVIDAFRAEGNSFLMPPYNLRVDAKSIIDISHESIMRVWKRLANWVSEENESAQLYLRLSKSAELYQDGKTGLLVNPDLQIALKWRQDNSPNEIWAMRYDPAFDRTISYLEFSKKEYEKAIAAREERQKRNLKRTRAVAIFMGAASLISITFLIVALNLKLKAEASEKKAKENEKLALTESQLAEDQKKEAISHKKIAEQQQMIADEQRRMADEQRIIAFEQRKEALIQRTMALKAKFEADIARDRAKRLQVEAENLRDSALIQKDRAEKQKSRAEFSEARTDTLRKLAVAKTLAIQAIKLSQNNKKSKNITSEQADLPLILAYQSYYFNKTYKGNYHDPDIFSALSEVSNTTRIVRGQNIHTDGIQDISVAHNGKWFVSCSDDQTVKIFSYDDLENPVNLKYPVIDKQYLFRSVAVSHDDKLIAAGTSTGYVMLWDSENQKNIGSLQGHTSSVNQIIFIPGNPKFITIGADGLIKSWNSSNLQENGNVIYDGTEKLTSAALNSSIRSYAVASETGIIRIFNIDNDKITRTVTGKNGKILSVCWGENDELIIGYASGKIEVLDNNNSIEFFAHESGINDLEYDQNNKRLISCGYDGKIKIWNMRDLDAEPAIIESHNSWVYAFSYNPLKSDIISGGADKIIILTKINIEEIKDLIRKNISANMSYKNWLYYVGNDIEYDKNLPRE